MFIRHGGIRTAGGVWTPQFSDADLVARGITTETMFHGQALTSPGNGTPAIDLVHIGPFPIRRNGTIRKIFIRMGTNGGAGSKLLMGIYGSDRDSYLPTTLLAVGAEHTADTGAVVVFSDVVSVAVTVGDLLWMAYTAKTGSPAPAVSVASTGIMQNSTTAQMGFAITRSYDGTLPTSLPLTGWATSSSVPDLMCVFA